MFTFINIATITSGDIIEALELETPDFEDALLMQCAKRCEIDLIVTRNIKRFSMKPCQVRRYKGM